MLGGLPVLALFSRCSFAQAIENHYPEADAGVAFEWEMPRSTALAVQRQLGLPDSDVAPAPNSETERGVPVLLIIIGLLALARLAKAIVDIYRDLRYGGIIIEDRGPKGLSIRNDPRLPSRVIIIKDKKGLLVRELSNPSSDELAGAISSLEGARKGALPSKQ